MMRYSRRPIGHAVSLLLCIVLTLPQACSVPSANILTSIAPDAFQGIAFYTDRSDGLIASINTSPTTSIHVFGRLNDDLMPGDIYKIILSDDERPSKEIGMEFDSQGRLAKLAVAGKVLGTYTYSADGKTVTEALHDGTLKVTYNIDTSQSPQEVFDRLGDLADMDLSDFFTRFSADSTPPLAKSIQNQAKASPLHWRLISATVNIVGLGLSTAALIAVAPQAGAGVMLLAVAGHTAALLNTGISLAQLFDSQGKLNEDPRVSNLAIGTSVTGYLLQPVSAGADAAVRGVAILEDSSIWAGFAVSKIDVFVTVLTSSPPSEGSGINLPEEFFTQPGGDDDDDDGSADTFIFKILMYKNPDGTIGTDGTKSVIQLSGDPAWPTISWTGLNAHLLLFDNPITTRVDYGVYIDSNEPPGTYLSSPIVYGDYSIEGAKRYIDASLTPFGLLPGIIYTVSISGLQGQAQLSFELH